MGLVERTYQRIDGRTVMTNEESMDGREVIMSVEVGSRRFNLFFNESPVRETFLQVPLSVNIHPVLKVEKAELSGDRSLCMVVPYGAYTKDGWQFVTSQIENPYEAHTIEYKR
ncbi:MAG TPA: hypothetical protein VGT05_03785 [Patescibacteria group bacterium]|nr:hypothetical protein [Patescibacteria group bacterium]